MYFCHVQRAMDWQYNTTVKAWTSQVAIAGKFQLTRDDTVQGQTVSRLNDNQPLR
jgi:hypothetical protein